MLSTVSEGGWYVPNGLMNMPPSAFFIIGFIIWGLRAWKRDQMETPEFNEVKVRPEQRAEQIGEQAS